jgi:hypothetical protein
MNVFTPVWLYIKQHNITGLKYFGKTTNDPHTYNGSGKYWKAHIKKHGNDVITVWTELFTDKDQLMNYALDFSKKHNIIESKEWANLIFENGIDGNVSGNKATEESKAKMSAAHKGQLPWNKGIVRTEEEKRNISNARKGQLTWNKGIARTQEVKNAISKANKGKTAWNKNINRTKEDKQKMKAGWDKKKADGFVAHNKGKAQTLILCEHCNKQVGGEGNYTRWHGDNCKMKELN